MGVENNTRDIEETVVTDFTDRMSYGGYLDLDTLLSAQKPLSDHHDELLFIIHHQTTELWMKLMVHELIGAANYLRGDDLGQALKCMARLKHIQKTLTEQWAVLATLTPSEYAQFRDRLGNSSGFQSFQYRAIEFMLGNKNEKMIAVFDSDPAAQALLISAMNSPSIYAEFLRYIARKGYAVPASILERDVPKAWTFTADLMPVFIEIYNNHDEHWEAYETCEELVDLEENFQFWRFRHLRTVQRIIGMKMGTGGSSGAPFLQKALELTFFPERFAVRTEIGK